MGETSPKEQDQMSTTHAYQARERMKRGEGHRDSTSAGMKRACSQIFLRSKTDVKPAEFTVCAMAPSTILSDESVATNCLGREMPITYSSELVGNYSRSLKKLVTCNGLNSLSKVWTYGWAPVALN